MASSKRKHGEGFKSYRKRMKNEAEYEKKRSCGRILWNSSRYGQAMRDGKGGYTEYVGRHQ